MKKENLTSDKLKDTWGYAKFSYEKDGSYGISWPQRNYRCSFCKREFKSAQALGGHMNVHRRDRAKMRLFPSGDSRNPNPNPNPNFCSSSSSSSAAKFIPYMTHQSCLIGLPLSSLASTDEEKEPMVVHSQCDPWRREIEKSLNKRAFVHDARELPVLAKRNDSRVWKKKEILRMDLNMGFLRDATDDLDLELRLGHS